MSIYPELPCSKIKIINGKSFIVRKYGLQEKVFEEELVPIPSEKIIKTLKEDGTEDLTKRDVVALDSSGIVIKEFDVSPK